ncbi:MAG TPA: HAMP domain-containing sensor histidine kinase [Kofleriaceae bacterium]|nr:HAMP domain-containing sensor histidine kinase [Kofleriaceae bacterium]
MGRRIPPLAVTFALLAAALVATAWSTRATISDAYATVREGQVAAMEQRIHVDFVELGGAPTSDDLAQIVQEHAADGLTYVATVDGRSGRITASGGTPLGALEPAFERPRITTIGDRVRVVSRLASRRGAMRGGWVIVEMITEQANELRGSATRTLAIGAIAALVLLGVAIALVRRELRRNAEERAREHERRLASLGEMSAVLAHEIKNPLASLKGNAQLLAAALPAGDKAAAKAARVVDEAQRLEKLTNDLLAFVRHGELHRAEISVPELLAAAAGDAPVELAAGALTWPLDADRMRQVFANLIDNARAAGPPPVRLAARVEGDRLIVEVGDRGPGVPPADRERIFEPFYTKKTQGTGLGLAIARRIVMAHGGTIGVSDNPGGGAVFRIAIPR